MTRLLPAFLLLVLCRPVVAATWYLAPAGNDAASGDSPATAWASFSHALSQMNQGDTLIVGDGNYTERVRILGRSGLALQAANRGGARISGGGAGPALEIRNSSNITVDGLRLREAGENDVLAVDADTAPGYSAQGATHDIVLRNLGIEGSCLQHNCSAAAISRSSEVLLEDSWIFGAGRYSLLVYGARNITIRRLAVRWDRWEGTVYKPDDPRHALNFYNTRDSLFENVFVLDAGQSQSATGDKGAISIGGNVNGDTPWDSSSNNRILGSLLVNNIGNGISIESPVTQTGNRIENVLVYGSSRHAASLNKVVDDTLFRHLTVVRCGGGIGDWSITVTGTRVYDSIFLENGGAQFNDDIVEDWNVLYGNSENCSGCMLGTHDTTGILPALPGLADSRDNRFFREVSSGATFDWPGAIIQQRQVGGALTNEALWPWPNENLIRADLCDPDTLARWQRIGSNAPGWCTAGGSLADYAGTPAAPPVESRSGASGGSADSGSGGGGGLPGWLVLGLWLGWLNRSRA